MSADLVGPPSTALPQVRVNPPSETDSDIAAYRGLSNGTQEVEIGMAEVVSGTPHIVSLRSQLLRGAAHGQGIPQSLHELLDFEGLTNEVTGFDRAHPSRLLVVRLAGVRRRLT